MVRPSWRLEEPAPQARLWRDLSHRFGVFPGELDCSLTDLRGMGLRHTDSFPGRLILLRISVGAIGAILVRSKQRRARFFFNMGTSGSVEPSN